MTRRFSAFLVAVLVAFVFSFSPAVSADQKGKSGGGKTVHVKEYKRKDGTTVKAHDRKAPGEKVESSTGTAAPPAHPRSDRCTECDRDAKGKILRSKDARNAFMKATGYEHGRAGYVIDHVVPLACHGQDIPSNMQWQTIADAKAKDRTEHAGCR